MVESNNVRVADFRDAIDSLYDTLRDRHACASDSERERWLLVAKRVADELRGMSCRTAKPRDLERQADALARYDAVVWIMFNEP